MRDDEKLSALVGDIYDAALDVTLWVAALAKCAEFAAGAAASIYSSDVAVGKGFAAYQSGFDPRYVQLYFDKYIKFDPTLTAYFFAEIEQPVATADVMPYDEFLETRFYKEWAQPQGLVDSVST